MSEKEMRLKPKRVFDLWEKGRKFKNGIGLYDEVELNENFFIGKQWEGVQANGLPTPVFNFLKKVTLFTVAGCTTDNLKMQAVPLGNSGKKGAFYHITKVVNNEFEALFEHNRVGSLVREYMRNAAVDGDGCTYTYFDPDVETGQTAKGAIVTEVVENTRVYFGNPCDRRVQTQPYIIIEKREMVTELKRRAKKLGVGKIDEIRPDSAERYRNGGEQNEDDYATVLMYLYRDDESGTVWFYECCREVELKHVDLGLRLYPVTWLNWDYRQDNYHGQALISGLIPNQIFVNKLFAMTMLSLMTSAYPKVVYDNTRVERWTNQVGAAIPVKGGDVNNVAKILDPAQVSPQIGEFIQMAVELTQTFLGATPAAMGETRPDNTSAIIALQRASSIPQEITKQNLHQSIEELGRIYLDFMGEYYGKRYVETTLPDNIPQEVANFAGLIPGAEQTELFDFAVLKEMPMTLKLDVGASAYWSEIASMQTLDNLLMQKMIGVDDYLERVPDGYISMRQELLDKIRNGSSAAMQGESPEEPMLDSGLPTPVEGGSGYGALQRKINQTGVTQ